MERDAKPRLLLTGASGFLGYHIFQEAKPYYQVLGVVNKHTTSLPGMQLLRLDVTHETNLRNMVREIRPDAIIHTAYISDINYCQTHQEETEKVNVGAPIYLAKLAAELAIPYVFTSSDMVFDGAKGSPYTENDPINPINHYGWQKAKAEEGIRHAYTDAAICRMPLMYGIAGPGSKNFFLPQLHSLRSGVPVRLFTDEYRTALGGISAARGLLLALRSFKGTYHLGGPERISRYQLGVLLAKVAGITEPNIVATRQEDVTMAAPRPKDVSLDSGKAVSLGYSPWANEEEMQQLLKELEQL